MNLIKPSILVVCLTFSVGACAMEEETETQSASILEIGEDSAPDWVVDRSNSDTRVVYAGDRVAYDVPATSTSSDEADVETPVTPETPVVDPPVSTDDSDGVSLEVSTTGAPTVRKYDCDDSVNMISHVNYYEVKAAAMETCVIRCDELQDWCTGFFYLSDSNRCGLVADLNADVTLSWVDAGVGSKVCFAN